ncbi:ABC transporter substrate-binding protein [Patescibacteria group bacterium]
MTTNNTPVLSKSKTVYFVIGILVLVLIAGLVTFLIPKDEETIKIGFIGPLTGPIADPGEYIKNSFELANTLNNIVDGKNIEVIYEDGKGIPAEGVTAATKLLNVDRVDIVVNALSGGSLLAVAPLTEEKEKILISSVSATPAVSEAGDYVFRISSSANLFAEKTALMIKELNYNNIGIIAENTEYAIGWKDSFIERFEGTLTKVETFNTGDVDVKTQLSKVDASNPDVILMLVQSPISAVTLIKQAKEMGIDKQIIGNEGFFARGVVKNLMGDAAEGVLVLTYKYDLGSNEMQLFFKDYESMYGEQIPEEMYGALGYDTYMLLYDALDHCNGADSKCLRDYLYTIENRSGVTGKFSLDAKGDGIRDFMWWKIKNKELIPF